MNKSPLCHIPYHVSPSYLQPQITHNIALGDLGGNRVDTYYVHRIKLLSLHVFLFDMLTGPKYLKYAQ